MRIRNKRGINEPPTHGDCLTVRRRREGKPNSLGSEKSAGGRVGKGKRTGRGEAGTVDGGSSLVKVKSKQSLRSQGR